LEFQVRGAPSGIGRGQIRERADADRVTARAMDGSVAD
jgi:hypothetical protein